MNRFISMVCLLSIMWLISGCYDTGTVDWYESFRFTGIVEEILPDKDMLVMKEIDDRGNTYKIPVGDSADYERGEKLFIIVETNTTEDIWDLEHMRFKIEPVGNRNDD